MNRKKLLSGIVILAFLVPFCAPVWAQDISAQYSSMPDQSAPSYSEAQLDQLLAPIALYPDSLLGQILMASTYPLEVVEAARWLQNAANVAHKGDALAAALEQQPWDPSVKSLVAFPQVLRMMDSHIQWTEQLGDAFLAQQDAVMDSVQRLRQQAQAAGNLTSTPQQVVSSDGSIIDIEPVYPNIVYVPVYNPRMVYGTWLYSDYPPYYFYPPNYVWGPSIIGFGIGLIIVNELWGWNHWDWRHHRIDIDDLKFRRLNHDRDFGARGVWEHDPLHRAGVPYRDAPTRERFLGPRPLETHRALRGFAPESAAPQSINRPTVLNTRPAKEFAPRVARPEPQRQESVRPESARPEISPENRQNMNRLAPEIAPQIRRPEVSQEIHRNMNRPAPEAAPSEKRLIGPVPVQRPSTPIFESFSRGPEVRAQSMRGAASLSIPSPVQHGSGGGGFHGGGNKNDDNKEHRQGQ